MKLKITGRGVYDKDGELIVAGTVLSIKGNEIPGWLVNKAEVIGAASDDAVVVVNVEEIDLEKKAEAARQIEADKAAAAASVKAPAAKA